MPSRIKSKLLIVTVLSATLAVLAVIAPMTAAIYSVIFMGVSLFLAVFAWGNAKKNKDLQYKISKFMTLNVLVVVGMFVSMSNIALGDVNTMLRYAGRHQRHYCSVCYGTAFQRRRKNKIKNYNSLSFTERLLFIQYLFIYLFLFRQTLFHIL